MKVLLVDPPLAHARVHYRGSPPFGLGVLAIDSYLEMHGVKDVELDNFFRCDWTEIEARLRRLNPDIVGASCLTDTRAFCWQLARTAKQVNPKVKVVLGSFHATFFAREILEHHPVDFCVLGEGEETMLELVRALESGDANFAGILGLAWRNGRTGEVHVNARRPLLKDLDAIPISTKRRLFGNALGRQQANMLSSRGCPFACGFCSSPSFWGRTWRKRRPEKVVEEFEMLKAQGAGVIEMADDLFTMDLQRAEAICDILIARGNRTPWFARARVDRITEHLIDKMIAAGCEEVSFGIESGDPEIIRRVNKKIDLNQAAEVFRMLARKKLYTQANFMIGNPGESPATVQKSIDLACRLNPSRITVCIAQAYPHTMLDEEAQKHGLLTREMWYLKTDSVPYYTVDMPLEQMQALSTKMVFRWALRRSLWDFLKMVHFNWQNVGTRRSLSFIFSWLASWLPGRRRPAAAGGPPTPRP
jgi:radical SAM superfamily enzyme YgiQ (UPF0313 family)